MALGWIIFCTMKTLGSYIILVVIFYQILIQMFCFSRKIYLPIDNMIITIHFLVIFLPYIVHIINSYFKFINSPWLLNIKQQPRQNLLKKYRKRLYWKKLKIKKFSPTNNQLLEKTDKANCLMTKQHPETNQYLLSNLRCYLAPKKYWRKNVLHQLFWYLCWFWCLVLCNTWWNWFHYRYF